MYLSRIKDTAERFGTSLAKVLGVNVLIVDQDLTRIVDTFEYPKGEAFPMRRKSVVGQIIQQKSPLVMDNRDNFHTCAICDNVQTCQMAGVVGVPVMLGGEAIGALALIVPNRGKNSLYHFMNNAVPFLEECARVLAQAVQNQEDRETIDQMNGEWESLLDLEDDAIAITDSLGEIRLCNRAFRERFFEEGACRGGNILSLIRHPLVCEVLDGIVGAKEQPILFESGGVLHRVLFSGCRLGLPPCESFLFAVGRAVPRQTLPSGSENRYLSELWNGAAGTQEALVALGAEKLEESGVLLLVGEADSGKRALAAAIWQSRAGKESAPFHIMNPGAYTADVMEKVLFGDKVASCDIPCNPGLAWLSMGGALLINRVELLPLYLQQRLVEALSAGGAPAAHTLRLIMTTTAEGMLLLDASLAAAVKDSGLSVPPLRERADAILPIFKAYLLYYCQKTECQQPSMDEKLRKKIRGYAWPGNLRQLELAAQRMVAGKKSGRALSFAQLITPYTEAQADAEGNHSMEELEREHIEQLLASGKGKEEIAAILKIGRATLYRKIKKYGL